jgi:hypothetical protein
MISLEQHPGRALIRTSERSHGPRRHQGHHSLFSERRLKVPDIGRIRSSWSRFRSTNSEKFKAKTAVLRLPPPGACGLINVGSFRATVTAQPTIASKPENSTHVPENCTPSLDWLANLYEPHTDTISSGLSSEFDFHLVFNGTHTHHEILADAASVIRPRRQDPRRSVRP